MFDGWEWHTVVSVLECEYRSSNVNSGMKLALLSPYPSGQSPHKTSFRSSAGKNQGGSIKPFKLSSVQMACGSGILEVCVLWRVAGRKKTIYV